MKIKLYDNFELQEVGEYDAGDDTTFIEPIFNWKDREQAIRTFWTVYGHLPTGGVSSLMDFDDEKIAQEHLDFFNELLKGNKE